MRLLLQCTDRLFSGHAFYPTSGMNHNRATSTYGVRAMLSLTNASGIAARYRSCDAIPLRPLHRRPGRAPSLCRRTQSVHVTEVQRRSPSTATPHVECHRQRRELVLAHPIGDERYERCPEEQVQIGPEHLAIHALRCMQQMVTVTPMNANVDKKSERSLEDAGCVAETPPQSLPSGTFHSKTMMVTMGPPLKASRRALAMNHPENRTARRAKACGRVECGYLPSTLSVASAALSCTLSTES
jgi:hypothetical protein